MRHSWTNRYRRQEEKNIEKGSFVQLCASVLSWQFSKAWPFVVARHDEVEQSWARAARVIMRPSPLGHWPWDVEQWHECGWRYWDGWQCDRSCLTGLNCTFLIPDFVQTNPLLISLQDDCSEIVSLNFEPQCHSVSQYVTICHNMSQCVTMCHNVSQCVTMCHNVSQCVTMDNTFLCFHQKRAAATGHWFC